MEPWMWWIVGISGVVALGVLGRLIPPLRMVYAGVFILLGSAYLTAGFMALAHAKIRPVAIGIGMLPLALGWIWLTTEIKEFFEDRGQANDRLEKIAPWAFAACGVVIAIAGVELWSGVEREATSARPQTVTNRSLPPNPERLDPPQQWNYPRQEWDNRDYRRPFMPNRFSTPNGQEDQTATQPFGRQIEQSDPNK